MGSCLAASKLGRADPLDLHDELDRQVSFALLASFEAIVRVDFQNRVDRRPKGGPGPAFVDLARKHAERVRRAGELKETLKIRHWLAHGKIAAGALATFDGVPALADK